MLIKSRNLLLALALSPAAFAQEQLVSRPVPSASKYAGIYHVSTGTWTRHVGSTANLGPDVIYDNTADGTYFGDVQIDMATDDYSIIDEGRLPGPDSDVLGVDRDGYFVNGLTFGYCTEKPGPTVGITFRFYESYNPCDLVATNPADTSPFTLSGIATATGLPGGASGAPGCWILTLDLEGAGEFCMEAEGGNQFPGHDGDLMRDSFGIEWIFQNVAGFTTGPLLSGNPDWSTSVPGALLHGGGGTYYDTTGGTGCGSTGLDTGDFVAVDGVNAPIGPGCFFFGGYLNTNGCSGPVNNPFTSFYTVIYADLPDCIYGDTLFCSPSNPNSSGDAATLSVSSSSTGSGMHLDAQGGPQMAGTGFGYFLISAGFNVGVPLGDGLLCLSTPQGRYAPAAGGALNSLGKFDLSGDFENLAGTSTTGFGFDIPLGLPTPPGGSIASGSTWMFQLWYRDLNPNPTVNFSDGIAITF